MAAPETGQGAARPESSPSTGDDPRGDLVARLAAELVEQGRRSALREREQAAEIDRLRAEVKALARHRRRANRLQKRLDEVYDSATWKAGAAALWLPKRALGRRPRG